MVELLHSFQELYLLHANSFHHVHPLQVYYDDSTDGQTHDLAYAQLLHCYKLAKGNLPACACAKCTNEAHNRHSYLARIHTDHFIIAAPFGILHWLQTFKLACSSDCVKSASAVKPLRVLACHHGEFLQAASNLLTA